MSSYGNRGARLEADLDRQHLVYRARGLAEVFRTPPPVRVVSRVSGGKFKAVFAGAGPPDFAGVLAGGRAVMVEAKTCAATRWKLAKLEEHQAAALARCDNLGGLALVVLAYAPTSSAWALPWAALGPRWRARTSGVRGAASLGHVDLAEVGRELRGVDWLAACPSRQGGADDSRTG